MKDEAAESWLSSLTETTRKPYKTFFHLFQEFTGMNGDQILAERKKSENGRFKQKILQFRQWIIETKKLSQNSAKTATGVIRGFLSYYDLPVKFSRSESGMMKRANKVRDEYRYSKSDLYKLSMVSDLKEKYIVIVGKSLGLRASDFIKLTYGHYRALNLDEEPPIFMGELGTIREGIRAYPFLDSDSVPMIKQILESNKDIPDNERVLDVRKQELSAILQRLTRKAGIPTGNKHIGFHSMRRYLIDRLSSHMSESTWKQIVGKTVVESAYVSPESLKEDYSRAMKDIVISNGNGLTATKIETLENALLESQKQIASQEQIIRVLREELAKNSSELAHNRRMLRHALKTLTILQKDYEDRTHKKLDPFIFR